MPIETYPLDVAHWPDLVTLFESDPECRSCWCLNHHWDPTQTVPENEAAKNIFYEKLKAGEVHGILAYRNGQVAGWCAIDPRPGLIGHDCVIDNPSQAENIWSIHCFFIHQAHRGHGLSRRLLDAAISLAQSQGATHIEAYPTRPQPGREIFDFSGPYAIFESQDFELIAELNPMYTQMVKTL